MNGSNMCTATMLLWKKDRHIHIFGNVLSMWRLSSFQQQKVRSANVFEFQRFERGVDAVAPKHARCEAWFNWETGLGVTTWGIRWRKSYLLEVTGQPLQLIYRYWDDIGESHLVANWWCIPDVSRGDLFGAPEAQRFSGHDSGWERGVWELVIWDGWKVEDVSIGIKGLQMDWIVNGLDTGWIPIITFRAKLNPSTNLRE